MAELLLPALAEGAALASTGMGQHGAQLGSPAGLGADGTTVPTNTPQGAFLRPSNKFFFFLREPGSFTLVGGADFWGQGRRWTPMIPQRGKRSKGL